MTILTESSIFDAGQIANIEREKNAKYVCETCLRNTSGGWSLTPVAVFWNRDPANIPEGGSPWFGLYYRPEYPHPEAPMTLFIVNAISATQHPIIGAVAANGDIVYSHHRHDMRYSPDESVWIDGGRDYVRHGGGELVNLQIEEGELVQSPKRRDGIMNRISRHMKQNTLSGLFLWALVGLGFAMTIAGAGALLQTWTQAQAGEISVKSLDEQVSWSELPMGDGSTPSGWARDLLYGFNGPLVTNPFFSEPLNLRVTVGKTATDKDGCAHVMVLVESPYPGRDNAILPRRGRTRICKGPKV